MRGTSIKPTTNRSLGMQTWLAFEIWANGYDKKYRLKTTIAIVLLWANIRRKSRLLLWWVLRAVILHLLSAFLFLSGFYSLLVVYYPFCLLLKHHCVLATMQSQVFGGDVIFEEGRGRDTTFATYSNMPFRYARAKTSWPSHARCRNYGFLGSSRHWTRMIFKDVSMQMRKRLLRCLLCLLEASKRETRWKLRVEFMLSSIDGLL